MLLLRKNNIGIFFHYNENMVASGIPNKVDIFWTKQIVSTESTKISIPNKRVLIALLCFILWYASVIVAETTVNKMVTHSLASISLSRRSKHFSSTLAASSVSRHGSPRHTLTRARARASAFAIAHAPYLSPRCRLDVGGPDNATLYIIIMKPTWWPFEGWQSRTG